jgi:hypothetical protein
VLEDEPDRNPTIIEEYGKENEKAKITAGLMCRTTKPEASNFVYWKGVSRVSRCLIMYHWSRVFIKLNHKVQSISF